MRSKKWKSVCVIVSGLLFAVFLTGISKAGEWSPYWGSGLKEEKRIEYRQQAAQDWLKERKIEVPDDVRKACRKCGDKYGISEYMLMAIAYKESRFKTTAENGPCKGAFQVNVNYHPHNWQDINANCDAACQVIMGVIKKYGCEDLADICSMYHGEGHIGYSDYTGDIDELSIKLMEADGQW